jgi:predicted S18 family serine protease
MGLTWGTKADQMQLRMIEEAKTDLTMAVSCAFLADDYTYQALLNAVRRGVRVHISLGDYHSMVQSRVNELRAQGVTINGAPTQGREATGGLASLVVIFIAICCFVLGTSLFTYKQEAIDHLDRAEELEQNGRYSEALDEAYQAISIQKKTLFMQDYPAAKELVARIKSGKPNRILSESEYIDHVLGK